MTWPLNNFIFLVIRRKKNLAIKRCSLLLLLVHFKMIAFAKS